MSGCRPYGVLSSVCPPLIPFRKSFPVALLTRYTLRTMSATIQVCTVLARSEADPARPGYWNGSSSVSFPRQEGVDSRIMQMKIQGYRAFDGPPQPEDLFLCCGQFAVVVEGGEPVLCVNDIQSTESDE
jgi:hypothetical protein